MSLNVFQEGTVICNEGDSINSLLIITKGKAKTDLYGHTFHFEKGDLIGLGDLGLGSYSHTYVAETEVTVFQYPYNENTIKTVLRDNADIANMLVNTVCRQATEFLRLRQGLKLVADGAYRVIKNVYPQYERLCNLYALSSKVLDGAEDITNPEEMDPVENWVQEYYSGINGQDAAIRKDFFYKQVGISTGFFERGLDDILKIFESCRMYKGYLDEVAPIFISEDNHDLFGLASNLHIDSINIRGADETMKALMAQIESLIPQIPQIDKEVFEERNRDYLGRLSLGRTNQSIVDAPTGTALKQNLSDSLNDILEYSELDEELSNVFIRQVHEYIKTPDRNSSEDDVYRLRRELTQCFYSIYTRVFMKYVKDNNPPTVIKMFLNFGYMDAELAGYGNADKLYSMADSLKGDKEKGIYTLKEWLLMIYKGEREPCRNEFDLDYPAYIRELKQSKKFDDKEEKRLLADQEGKLRFELENAFPIVNKITFGRLSTYCPLFADHNLQKKIESSLVTAKAVYEIFEEVRSIDHSVFYRESSYSHAETEITKEFVHREYLPEVILLPNIGTRGVMWQEVEGKNKNSPARIFLPLMLLNDLKPLLIRVVGEFRWEMCKRVQGSRWADLSAPSLTSEYFSYLQFYRSNKELSTEAKDLIKTSITRARNDYKQIFAENYLEWIVYEANGSPRMNKTARRILLEYCTFSREIREKVSSNPQFGEIIKKYEFKQQARIRQLTNVINRVEKSGKPVPQDMLNEFEFANR